MKARSVTLITLLIIKASWLVQALPNIVDQGSPAANLTSPTHGADSSDSKHAAPTPTPTPSPLGSPVHSNDVNSIAASKASTAAPRLKSNVTQAADATNVAQSSASAASGSQFGKSASMLQPSPSLSASISASTPTGTTSSPKPAVNRSSAAGGGSKSTSGNSGEQSMHSSVKPPASPLPAGSDKSSGQTIVVPPGTTSSSSQSVNAALPVAPLVSPPSQKENAVPPATSAVIPPPPPAVNPNPLAVPATAPATDPAPANPAAIPLAAAAPQAAPVNPAPSLSAAQQVAVQPVAVTAQPAAVAPADPVLKSTSVGAPAPAAPQPARNVLQQDSSAGVGDPTTAGLVQPVRLPSGQIQNIPVPPGQNPADVVPPGATPIGDPKPPDDSSSGNPSGQLSAGGIAGIVIGLAVALLAVLGFAVARGYPNWRTAVTPSRPTRDGQDELLEDEFEETFARKLPKTEPATSQEPDSWETYMAGLETALTTAAEPSPQTASISVGTLSSAKSAPAVPGRNPCGHDSSLSRSGSSAHSENTTLTVTSASRRNDDSDADIQEFFDESDFGSVPNPSSIQQDTAATMYTDPSQSDQGWKDNSYPLMRKSGASFLSRNTISTIYPDESVSMIGVRLSNAPRNVSRGVATTRSRDSNSNVDSNLVRQQQHSDSDRTTIYAPRKPSF